MRCTHALLILIAGVLVLPNLTWSQGGGGRSGGGLGSPPNSDELFNRFSGGKDEIVVSQLDERQQRFFQYLGPQLGLTGDRISREQFRASQERVNTMFQPGGARMSGQGTPGGGTTGGMNPMGGQGGMNPMGGRDFGQGGQGFGQGGFGQGGFGQSGPGFGQGGERNDDQRSEFFFRQMDKNSDGLLNYEEMSETLQRERDTWDKNKNGFIELTEFKEYITARNSQRDENRGGNNERRPNGQPGNGNQPRLDDNRPSVYRAGNLPKDLPDWFVKMDREGDVDGQVGLYEWRKSRNLEEFLTLDLNEDGFITAEEFLRWKDKTSGRTSGNSMASANGAGGGRFGGQGGGFGGQGGGFPGFGGQGRGFPGFGSQGGGFPGFGSQGGGFPGFGSQGGFGQGDRFQALQALMANRGQGGGFPGFGGQGGGFPGMGDQGGGQGGSGFMGGQGGQGGNQPGRGDRDRDGGDRRRRN